MPGKTLTLVALAVLVALVVYLGSRGGSDGEHQEGPGAVPSRTERPEGGPVLDARVAKMRERKLPEERSKVLAELKERWAVLKPGGNSVIKEKNALAKESVELLLCSAEAIELMAWLDAEGMRYGALKMRNDLQRRLRSADSGDLREMLTFLPALPSEAGKTGHYLIQNLCNAAGQGCPPDEFEDFVQALQSDAYVVEGTLGRNLVAMRTDPAAGIRSTLELWKGSVHSLSKWDHLNRQMREEFPPAVDYGELERVLPEFDPAANYPDRFGGAVEDARRGLLRNWAKRDLDAAADYVLENSDRLEPKLMRTIAGTGKFAKPEEAVKWVERFEEGPYFDEAARGVLHTLNYYKPEVARALAERIGDPALRAEAIKAVETQVREEEGG